MAGFLWLVARSWMELPFDAPWQIRGSMTDGLGDVWFIFVWGTGITFLVGFLQILARQPRDEEPAEIFLVGLWKSLNAGLFEEMIFRWLMFMSVMVLLQFLNFITFGIVRWVYVEGFIPLANWLTLGALSPQLLGAGWVLAAAVVMCNWRFQTGHIYLGWFGWLNSWFLGMVFFWLMFNYGLWTAIVAHILYDAGIFTVAAIVATMQPRYSRYNSIRQIVRSSNRRRYRAS